MNFYQQPQNSFMPGYQQYAPSYTPSYQQQYTPPQQNTQPIQSGIVWVRGAQDAESYRVPPNNTVLLMDSEGGRFYLKSADAAGMNTIKTYTYHEENVIKPREAEATTQDYVRRDEFEALKAKIEGLDVQPTETTQKIAKIKKAADNE